MTGCFDQMKEVRNVGEKTSALSCIKHSRVRCPRIWTAGPEGFGVPGFGLRVQKDLGYRDFRLLACCTAFILSSSSWKCRLGVSDHMSVVKCWRWSVGDKVLSDHVLMVKCWWVVGCKGLVLKCCWSVHLGTHGIFWIMRRKIWWHLTFFYTHLSGSVTSSVWM